ncbi:MAG: hypothetical protein H6733_10315 [Alphaproteobacteria bacterium]|nr:hypothetical protein [Alphaproteobacteria bacterium]
MAKCVTKMGTDWVAHLTRGPIEAWCSQRRSAQGAKDYARSVAAAAQRNGSVSTARHASGLLDLADVCQRQDLTVVHRSHSDIVGTTEQIAAVREAERVQQAEARQQEEQRRREELLTGTDVELLAYCDVTLVGMRTAIRRVQEVERAVNTYTDADDFRDRVAEAQVEAQEIWQRARLDLASHSSLLFDVVAELGRRADRLHASEARRLLEARDERCRLQ